MARERQRARMHLLSISMRPARRRLLERRCPPGLRAGEAQVDGGSRRRERQSHLANTRTLFYNAVFFVSAPSASRGRRGPCFFRFPFGPVLVLLRSSCRFGEAWAALRAENLLTYFVVRWIRFIFSLSICVVRTPRGGRYAYAATPGAGASGISAVSSVGSAALPFFARPRAPRPSPQTAHSRLARTYVQSAVRCRLAMYVCARCARTGRRTSTTRRVCAVREGPVIRPACIDAPLKESQTSRGSTPLCAQAAQILVSALQAASCGVPFRRAVCHSDCVGGSCSGVRCGCVGRAAIHSRHGRFARASPVPPQYTQSVSMALAPLPLLALLKRMFFIACVIAACRCSRVSLDASRTIFLSCESSFLERSPPSR